MPTEWKIYRVEEAEEWYLAHTPEEALTYMQSLVGDGEHPGATAEEVSATELDELILEDEDGIKRTFREALQKLQDAGIEGPTVFASENY